MGCKRKSCGLLLAVLLPLSAAAEVICALGSGASAYNAASDQRPTPDAMEVARRLNTAFTSICSPKCPQIAMFRNTTAANAMLVLNGDDAKLVYAPKFFQSIDDTYGDGAVIAVIAHEFGHALDEIYPARFKNAGSTQELRADAWSGCALAKVDLSPADLGGALFALAKYPSLAHPTWALRLPALRTGYTECNGEGAKFDNGVDRSKRQAALSGR
jgi:hypothetical protein